VPPSMSNTAFAGDNERHFCVARSVTLRHVFFLMSAPSSVRRRRTLSGSVRLVRDQLHARIASSQCFDVVNAVRLDAPTPARHLHEFEQLRFHADT
jgi:hypothetical protein